MEGDSIRNIVFEEECVHIPIGVISIDQSFIPDPAFDTPQDNIAVPSAPEVVPGEQTLAPQEPMPLRRSTRVRRSALSDDYIVFLHEHEVNIGLMETDSFNSNQTNGSSNSQEWIDVMNDEIKSLVMEDDPINFHQAMESANSHKWLNAMNEEMQSMKDNDVWDLVPLPEGVKPIGNKWIFKTKRDSNGNVERYKARLVV